MKSPLALAILTGLGLLAGLWLVEPAVLDWSFPPSSDICIEPSPPNQIKSIQISSEAARSLLPPWLARSLKPALVCVRINPYFCPDTNPVLYIDLPSGMMEVNHDWVRKARGVFDTPFSEQALQDVFARFKAPRSPQQGAINVAEVYATIKALSTVDVRGKSIPGVDQLKHYTLSYIHPYREHMEWLGAFAALSCAVSVYRWKARKEEAKAGGK